MLRENWFPIPIWSIQTNIDTKTIAEKCLQMREENHPNRVRSNYGGWQSKDLDLDLFPEFHDFRDSLYLHINLLAKEVSPTIVLKLDNVWLNINSRGNTNSEHVHPWSTFSGAFYIQTNDDTGNIRFTNKWCPSIHYGFTPIDSDIFYEYVTYKPKNGMMLFFPSWLSHYVMANESDLPRISMSFNIRSFKDEW